MIIMINSCFKKVFCKSESLTLNYIICALHHILAENHLNRNLARNISKIYIQKDVLIYVF